MQNVFCIALVLVMLAPGVATARSGENGQVVRKLNDDQLGESLQKFRSRHKGVKCHRRPNEAEALRDWLLWVDCSIERGISLRGQKVLAETNPSEPFGVFAKFYKKRLVELSYTLPASSASVLFPIFVKELGKPSRTFPSASGDMLAATWADHQASLELGFVSLSPTVADEGFLRIGQGNPVQVFRVRLSRSDMTEN